MTFSRYELIFWAASHEIIKITLVVHFAMHRRFASRKLSSSPLHLCLSPFLNTRWPQMHDRIPIRTAPKSIVSL